MGGWTLQYGVVILVMSGCIAWGKILRAAGMPIIEAFNAKTEKGNHKMTKYVTIACAAVMLLSGRVFGADPSQASPPLGCWQDETQKALVLRCEPARVTLMNTEKGSLQMFCATFEPGKICLHASGHKIVLTSELQGDTLVLKGEGQFGAKRLKKLDKTPDHMDIAPIKLGDAGNVPPAEMGPIQEELVKRLKEDEAVQPNPKQPESMKKFDPKHMNEVTTANTKYLLGVVSKYGWIDAERFGGPANSAAMIIVQHSNHPPLMLAVLPEIKKHLGPKERVQHDATALQAAKSYTSIYDRVKLLMGEKQRFGTQLTRNEKGEIILLALEDKAKVDEFRGEIGLPPISQLLKPNPQTLAPGLKIEED